MSAGNNIAVTRNCVPASRFGSGYELSYVFEDMLSFIVNIIEIAGPPPRGNNLLTTHVVYSKQSGKGDGDT